MAFDEGEWSASCPSHSPPSGAEVMNEWIYYSAPQHDFMVWSETKFISILPLPFFHLIPFQKKITHLFYRLVCMVISFEIFFKLLETLFQFL
jgi:hypothetical protein